MTFSIKKIIHLLLLLIVTLVSCGTDSLEGFQKISIEYSRDRTKLISRIEPDKKYLYWEYVSNPGIASGTKEILKKSGNVSIKAKYSIKIPKEGFFVECMPLYCYSYIMYIDQGQVHYITDERGLKTFIGRVDNLEEALLIAKINGLWFDPDEMKAGSYKKTEKGFELNLLKYDNCPVKMEAIKVDIDFLGNFKFENMGVYYKSADCILS